jgi:2-dehydro-3-deoxygluconokinase
MPGQIVCFGEVLIRLASPARERLLQSPHLEIQIGGAEANVAVSMAHFGHRTSIVGAITDNALGDAALSELRRHGVDVDRVLRRQGRMGLYFLETGTGYRPSEVLYDRANSAFANTGNEHYDWPTLLADTRLLHISGVTPALSQPTADAAVAAARAARAAGIKVSFDGNFRPKLWAAWDGDPRKILRELIGEADYAFADHRDIAMVLDEEDSKDEEPTTRFAAAAVRAFSAFPRLDKMISTIRTQHSVDDHHIGAIMATRDGALHVAPTYTLHGIVDRIGAGDAFAAGALHGLLDGMDDAKSLHFGLAAACLKHSIPGDFNRVNRDEVFALMRNERLDVKR